MELDLKFLMRYHMELSHHEHQTALTTAGQGCRGFTSRKSYSSLTTSIAELFLSRASAADNTSVYEYFVHEINHWKEQTNQTCNKHNEK